MSRLPTPVPHDYDPDAPGLPGEGLFGLPCTPDNAGVVVIPVPFDATASFHKGTAAAPPRVAEASLQVDLHDPHVDMPWRVGIAMLPSDGVVEAWNEEASALADEILAEGGAESGHAGLARVNAIGDAVNGWVAERARRVLDRGAIPAVLGGDHSVPFGAIQVAAERYPGLGILHVDAHADLREAYMGFTWSHASIMYNVRQRIPNIGRIVQVGIRDYGRAEAERMQDWSNLTAWTDHEIAWRLAGGEPWLRLAAGIVAKLPKKVWISFDIDGLDPALCAHTGTPVPGGLSWRDVQVLLRLVAEDHDIVGFDLCEVGDADFDANVGARLLYRMASWAVHTRHRDC